MNAIWVVLAVAAIAWLLYRWNERYETEKARRRYVAKINAEERAYLERFGNGRRTSRPYPNKEA